MNTHPESAAGAGPVPFAWSGLDPRALGRLMTAIERRTDVGRRAAVALAAEDPPGITVGITGPPGCGKSTLVGRLIRELRGRDARVGVLAIDPSSAFHGGALLGDRLRMMDAATDPGVVIRSLGSRGSLGGVVPAVAPLATLLRCHGASWVLIETVGVGQDELDIVAHADVVVVVQAPGAGDDIQAMKKGILEIADVLVVNKADLPGADDLLAHLGTWATAGDAAPLRTDGLSGAGVAAVIDRALEIARQPGRRGRDRGHARLVRRLALDTLAERLDARLAAGAPAGDAESAAARLVADLLGEPPAS
jgi:LAO/AO transport system kinase